MERALSAVNAEAEGKGVSTQSIDALIQAMEASGVSKEHVSRICAEIDEPVQSPIKRPLEDPFPYVWLEATYVKARNGGRVVDRAIMIAVGLTEVGRREVLGIMVGPCPTEASWLGIPASSPGPRSSRHSVGHAQRPRRPAQSDPHTHEH